MDKKDFSTTIGGHVELIDFRVDIDGAPVHFTVPAKYDEKVQDWVIDFQDALDLENRVERVRNIIKEYQTDTWTAYKELKSESHEVWQLRGGTSQLRIIQIEQQTGKLPI